MTDLVRLGKSEVLVSPLGVGVMTWGERTRTYGGTRGRDAEAGAFETSLASGVNFFDTAEMYGRGASETRFGELARGQELVVATKFAPLPGRTAGSLPRALGRSLSRLRRTSVDLYQIHFHTPWMRILFDLINSDTSCFIISFSKAPITFTLKFNLGFRDFNLLRTSRNENIPRSLLIIPT